MELKLAEEMLVLSIPPKMMNEVRKTLSSWERKGMVPLREVRALTGRLSWICGIITRARWCFNIFYAVISQTMNEAALEPERARKRDDPRPKPHMVAVHRMELPRQWFLAMYEKPDKFALRREPLHAVLLTFALVIDPFSAGSGRCPGRHRQGKADSGAIGGLGDSRHAGDRHVDGHRMEWPLQVRDL